jgi:hypothetical protein
LDILLSIFPFIETRLSERSVTWAVSEKTRLDNEHALSEQMRFRDLVLQVERFLKYASKGTSPEVLRKQARDFAERLSVFKDGFDQSKIRRLSEKLDRICSTGAAP